MTFFIEKEQLMNVPGPAGNLEAIVHEGDLEGVFAERDLLVILCHPHPAHGGTMDHKVVTTLMRTYRDLGIHVVRFNFRGVGKSEGAFANGVGELDDLFAIIYWVKAKLPTASLLLAGFSFGSSIAAQASYQVENLQQLTLVAPPIERYPYVRDQKFPAPLCVIQGDKDERVIAEGVYAWIEALQSPVTLLRYPETGHFFHGALTTIKADLTRVLLHQLRH